MNTAHEALLTILRNIAGGSWNVGRKPEDHMTAAEYAEQALKGLGFARAAVEEDAP
jgi:hypothetical protein